jgi:hypothetical protein
MAEILSNRIVVVDDEDPFNAVEMSQQNSRGSSPAQAEPHYSSWHIFFCCAMMTDDTMLHPNDVLIEDESLFEKHDGSFAPGR